MQAAIDHLEKYKVLDEKSNTYVVPLEQAYHALSISIDQQLVNVLTTLESSLGELNTNINKIQNNSEND